MSLKCVKLFLEKVFKYAKHPRNIEKRLFCELFDYSINEYDYYNFKKRSIIDRLSFVSNKKSREIIHKCNKRIANKKDNYLLLKKYFGRDVIIVDKDVQNGKLLIDAFLKRHGQVIVKGFRGASGSQIKKYEITNNESVYNEIITDYPNGCLIEEIIHQTDELESLHPQSINTLRITTVNIDNKVKTIYPVLRIGVGKNIIDNNKQSLLCAIDEKSGKVLSALDYCGKEYTSHPDTSVQLIDFIVPELESAITLAKELATYFPENVFTGFDFAHTINGWILVEANTETRFTIWQLPYQKGYKKEAKIIIKGKAE